ncbi:O-antigen ligase family protein [Priestia aryabhattai]
MNFTKMKNDKLIRTLILWLFLVGISLITYDKLPFLNYSSYSPSAIFPFFAAFLFILLIGYKVERYDKWLIIFMIISTIHSLIAGAIYNDYNSSFTHIFTLIIGFSTFVVIRFAFLNKSDNRLYERAIFLSLIIPISLGFLQMINTFGFNIGFIYQITHVFAAHLFQGRIQLTSSEPSWAVMHLLALGSLVLFMSRRTKFTFTAMVILFFMSFSALGYGVLFFSFFLFGLITKKHRGKVFVFMGVLIALVFILVPFLINVFDIQDYYIRRFDYRYLFSREFLATDASGFVRIVYPLIGWIQFIEFPLGHGGGFFYTHFREVITNHFLYGLSFESVQADYDAVQNTNARNLWMKLLSEEGIINLPFFILFLIGVFKKCKSNLSRYVFCLAISLLLNFDSYALVDFWLLLAVAASGYLDKREAKSIQKTRRLVLFKKKIVLSKRLYNKRQLKKHA